MTNLRTIQIEESLLSRNRTVAERLRGRFRADGTLVLNLLSSPGAGKTELLRRTLERLGDVLPAAVVVGDLATENDGRRLAAAGRPVVQIETGGICHLDAAMVERALDHLDTAGCRLLFIENVGNLVCPAAYDLGEDLRVALLSVTEGEDKPLKYPTAFQSADVVLITKVDIADAVGFDEAAARESIERMAPAARVMEVSARSGQGMDEWLAWLRDAAARKDAVS